MFGTLGEQYRIRTLRETTFFEPKEDNTGLEQLEKLRVLT